MGEEYVPNGLVAVAEQECWDLLAGTSRGHLGVSHGERILIVPVDYVLDGKTVVFGAPEGSPLDVAAGWGRSAAFQIDRMEEDAPEGDMWSVLVHGELRRADDADTERLGPLRFWRARGVRTVVGRILAEQVTGRRLPRR